MSQVQARRPWPVRLSGAINGRAFLTQQKRRVDESDDDSAGYNGEEWKGLTNMGSLRTAYMLDEWVLRPEEHACDERRNADWLICGCAGQTQ